MSEDPTPYHRKWREEEPPKPWQFICMWLVLISVSVGFWWGLYQIVCLAVKYFHSHS